MIQRPALRYHGGKWRLAPWIISFFPEHRIYVEPFGGGASVLIRKPASYLEVYNDINLEIQTFFRVLRERPEDLLKAIQLTPYHRAEYVDAQAPTADDLETARRVYIQCWQGRGRAGVPEPGGWRFMSRARESRSGTPVDDWCNDGHLRSIAMRLRHVQFECKSALAVIRSYDGKDVLFYVDPPYVHSTRGDRWMHAYRHEYTDNDHRQLSAVLHQVQAHVIVSGYDCPLYQELFADWRMVSRKQQKDSNEAGQECLWLSPSTKTQMQLFDLQAA